MLLSMAAVNPATFHPDQRLGVKRSVDYRLLNDVAHGFRQFLIILCIIAAEFIDLSLMPAKLVAPEVEALARYYIREVTG
jgi:hypothetical protein